MIGRVESFFRRMRRRVSRSEWLVRLCGLSVSEGTGTDPGLVMIQIDGLSHPELKKALDTGEMPFLKRLLDREDFRTHRHYSGLPSTTPSVQGELFYGRRSAVPAFGFRDHHTGQSVRMFEPEAVGRIENDLRKTGGKPLADGGSVYADIYTGGAAEAHFCPGDIGNGSLFSGISPFTLGLIFLANLYAFLRVAVLMIVETGLAVIDFFRGAIGGRNFFQELKFVPARVGICILLRELIVIGVKLDLVRGLPFVHLNLLGYDEQAHRRGPDSKFAHWTLQGIDDAIARIWRAAGRATRRDYDLWIYSDHGQERTRSYQKIHGKPVREAVATALGLSQMEAAVSPPDDPPRYREPFGKSRRRPKRFHGNMARSISSDFELVTPGPVGWLYSPQTMRGEEVRTVAKRIVSKAGVPLVIGWTGPNRLEAWTEEGRFDLPEEAERVFGRDHPFLDEIRRDLKPWCRHPDAGDLLLLGWRHGLDPVTFSIENGSHGGAGPLETSGFALLPVDAPVPESSARREHLRPGDLRAAALRLLGRAKPESASAEKLLPRNRGKASREFTLRLMTYNVHGCLGLDGNFSPQRIGRVIARHAPDIVALQELDVGRTRSGGIDQAHLIARHLEMDFHFHPTVQVEEERYGDAILSRLPMRLIKAAKLPGLPAPAEREPRGALWVAIEVAPGLEVQVINTHLGLSARERLTQVDALLGAEWLGHSKCRLPVIFCGDLNALPSSPAYRRLRTRLRDAQLAVSDCPSPKATFTSRFPRARIDHVFVDDSFEVTGIAVSASELARVSSDHLPLIVELKFSDRSPAWHDSE